MTRSLKYWKVAAIIIVGLLAFSVITNLSWVSYLANLDLDRKNFVVIVDGPSGMKFSRNCAGDAKTGSFTEFSAQEKIPYRFEYSTAKLTCTFQKNGGTGTLEAVMLRDGVTIASDKTNDLFGVVSVEGH